MDISLLLAATFVITPISIPGQSVQQAFGLNDQGQVAVNTDLSSGIYQRGTYTVLPPLPAGYSFTFASGINNSGTVTGSAIGSDFSRPGWEGTEPRSIGNSGLVIGYSYAFVG